jgi:hypothetical protein
MYVQTFWLVYFREILGYGWGVRGINEAKMGMAAANMATRIFRQCSLRNRSLLRVTLSGIPSARLHSGRYLS